MSGDSDNAGSAGNVNPGVDDKAEAAPTYTSHDSSSEEGDITGGGGDDGGE